jgi:hypothetical protein
MSHLLIRLGPAVLWIAITGPVYSQSPSFGGPITGFVFSDSSGAIRPLLGIPGAAYVGSPVMTGLHAGSVAPGGNWAFITKRRGNALIGGLSQSLPATVSVPGMMEQADLIAWSRNGAYALLYDSPAGRLQRIQFSTSSGAADAPIDLSAWGKATTLTIDPTGQRIAFGVPGGGVYLFNAGQQPVLVSPISQPTAIAFDDTGLHLYAADLASQQVLTFDSGGAQLPFASILHADGSASNPVGLAVSAGGRFLLVVDAASRSVLVYDILSQTLANTLPLAFVPSRLDALSSAPAFLLNGSNPQESLLILDASQSPYVYFVPAPGVLGK